MAQLEVTSEALGPWDSSLLVFLVQLLKTAHARKLMVRTELPDGLERLLRLAFAVPAKEGAGKTTQRPGLLAELGGRALGLPPKVRDFLDFLGDVTLALGRLCVGPGPICARRICSRPCTNAACWPCPLFL